MTAQELFTYLTHDAGLDDATAQAMVKAAANEKIAARAASLKNQTEYESLAGRAAALEASLNGAGGKPGAKQYQDWYEKNFGAIQKLQADVALYQERFGTLEAPKPTPAAAATGSTFTKEEVQKIVNETIQGGYAGRWSDLLTSSGTILEKHIRSGRKSNLDWKKLSEIAEAKGGDLVAAYDEWDKPEADKAAKDAEEKRIEARVKEELAKRQTSAFFPAGADASPSSTSVGITRGAKDKSYDRNKVIESAVTGKYDGAVIQ